jgi:phage-related protein
MKLLQFLAVLATFSLSSVAFSGAAKAKEASPESTGAERFVIVTIGHLDGSTSEYTIPESQLLSRGFDLGIGEMRACTWQFADGECTVTASTCAAAEAGFKACACASGHTHYCNQEEDQ